MVSKAAKFKLSIPAIYRLDVDARIIQCCQCDAEQVKRAFKPGMS